MRSKRKHPDPHSVAMAIRFPLTVVRALDAKAEKTSKETGFPVTRTDLIRKAVLESLQENNPPEGPRLTQHYQ